MEFIYLFTYLLFYLKKKRYFDLVVWACVTFHSEFFKVWIVKDTTLWGDKWYLLAGVGTVPYLTKSLWGDAKQHELCVFAWAWCDSWHLQPLLLHCVTAFRGMSYFFWCSWWPGAFHSHVASNISNKLKSLGVCHLIGQSWFSKTVS